jgi:hypothetical protein
MWLEKINNGLLSDPGGYILWSVEKHSYCIWASIDFDEFRHLLINTSPQNPDVKLSPMDYPIIQEAIEQIHLKPNFFEYNHPNRGLSGVRVKYYIDLFNQGAKLKECFIRDIQDMRPGGSFYIADGMHSLIAYAIWTKLNPEKFPIALYHCTNRLL